MIVLINQMEKRGLTYLSIFAILGLSLFVFGFVLNFFNPEENQLTGNVVLKLGEVGIGGTCATSPECINGAVCTSRRKCLLRANLQCSRDSQCASNDCSNLRCAKSMPPSGSCLFDSDCASGRCVKINGWGVCKLGRRSVGGICNSNSFCLSNSCTAGRCDPRYRYCERNNECNNGDTCINYLCFPPHWDGYRITTD